jgi:hypothetical protein
MSWSGAAAWLRFVSATIAGFCAIWCFAMAAVFLWLLTEDVARDRAIEAGFRSGDSFARAFRARHGRLPQHDEMHAWTRARNFPAEYSDMYLSADSCGDESFRKGDADEYILVVWRGERFECFASPSGATTLAPTIAEGLADRSDMLAYLAALGAALGWLSWRLDPAVWKMRGRGDRGGGSEGEAGSPLSRG